MMQYFQSYMQFYIKSMGWAHLRCSHNDTECDELRDFAAGSSIEIEPWLFVLSALAKWFSRINNCSSSISEVNVP